MFTATLIDNTIKDVDNLDPSVGSHTANRARYLRYAQDGLTDLWFRRNWTFRQAATNGTVTIAANGRSGPLPTDFLSMGRNGRVLKDGVPLDWVDPGTMQIIQEGGATTPSPDVYSIYGVDTTTTSDLARPLLQVQECGASTTLEIHGYSKVPPTLVDASTASLLETVPNAMIYRCLQSYMRARALDDKQDKRAAFWWQQYEQSIREAIKVDKQGHDTAQQRSGFFAPWENMA